MFGHPKMHENPFKNKTFESVRTFKNAQKFVQKHTHSKMYGHSKMRKISFTHTFTNVRIFKNRPQKCENAVQNNTHSKMCGYPKPSRNSTMCTPFFRSKTHTSETAHQNSKRSGFWRSRSKLATWVRGSKLYKILKLMVISRWGLPRAWNL